MSLYSAITNPNTIIRASQTSGKIDSTDCSVIFITIPNWPALSTIQRITVTRNDDPNMAAIKTTVYNGAIGDDVFGNLTGTDTFTFNSQGVQSVAVDYPIVNPSNYDFLQLSLHTVSGTFAKNATYTVEVIGIKNLPGSIEEIDTVPLKKDPYARFLIWNKAELSVKDITNRMTNSWVSSENPEDSITVCETVYDCLFIGTSYPLPTLYFSIDSTTEQVSASGSTGVDISYLNTGGNWVSLIGDGSISASGFITETSVSSSQKHASGTYAPYNSLFEYSGLIKFESDVPIAKTQLNTTYNGDAVIDPYYTMGEEIKAGTAFPIGMYNNPDRYWIRISFPTGTVPFKLHGIKILDY